MLSFLKNPFLIIIFLSAGIGLLILSFLTTEEHLVVTDDIVLDGLVIGREQGNSKITAQPSETKTSVDPTAERIALIGMLTGVIALLTSLVGLIANIVDLMKKRRGSES